MPEEDQVKEEAQENQDQKKRNLHPLPTPDTILFGIEPTELSTLYRTEEGNLWLALGLEKEEFEEIEDAIKDELITWVKNTQTPYPTRITAEIAISLRIALSLEISSLTKLIAIILHTNRIVHEIAEHAAGEEERKFRETLKAMGAQVLVLDRDDADGSLDALQKMLMEIGGCNGDCEHCTDDVKEQVHERMREWESGISGQKKEKAKGKEPEPDGKDEPRMYQ